MSGQPASFASLPPSGRLFLFKLLSNFIAFLFSTRTNDFLTIFLYDDIAYHRDSLFDTSGYRHFVFKGPHSRGRQQYNQNLVCFPFSFCAPSFPVLLDTILAELLSATRPSFPFCLNTPDRGTADNGCLPFSPTSRSRFQEPSFLHLSYYQDDRLILTAAIQAATLTPHLHCRPF